MKIPESFRVDKKPYAVSLVRHIWPKGTMGTVFYDLRHIEIATHSARSRRRFTRAEIADTFWHEVTDAALRDMGHSLWCSEKFVTGFSRRLTEVVMTASLPQQMAAPARRAPQEKSRTPSISRDGGSKRRVDVE